jgi:hypothetical protein
LRRTFTWRSTTPDTLSSLMSDLVCLAFLHKLVMNVFFLNAGADAVGRPREARGRGFETAAWRTEQEARTGAFRAVSRIQEGNSWYCRIPLLLVS